MTESDFLSVKRMMNTSWNHRLQMMSTSGTVNVHRDYYSMKKNDGCWMNGNETKNDHGSSSALLCHHMHTLMGLR